MGKKKKKKAASSALAGADVLREDAAGAVLLRRPSGESEWIFSGRAANAPPLAQIAEPMRSLEAAARIAGADPETYWWWLTDASLDGIGRELARRNYCVLDGVLGASGIAELRQEVRAVRESGQLSLSRLAGGRTGHGLTYSHAAVRGDLIGWFDGSEPTLWPRGTLSRYLTKMDTLVAQLGERVGAGVAAVASRSKAMVTCYPGGGARYVRHCDNSCDTGRGERCNGRRLTAILYLNEGWVPHQGGALRLYAPFAPKGVPPVCDVEPVADRLVLFYSDYRVPHEVLPAHAERYAITLWYFDKDEYRRARLSGAASDQTDEAEQEAIEGEIARFEARFGQVTERFDEGARATKQN